MKDITASLTTKRHVDRSRHTLGLSALMKHGFVTKREIEDVVQFGAEFRILERVRQDYIGLNGKFLRF
jgi:hypothetical protein